MRALTRFVGLAILVVGAGAEQARAASYSTSRHGFTITVEPIVGYEYTMRDTPTPHSKGMLIYGARLTAGRPHLAVEGEYTRGSDTEGFTSPVLSITTTRENVRLGLRGTYEMGDTFGASLRAGGQASRASITQVDGGGVSTQADQKWLIKPYAGAGLNIAVAQLFSVGVDMSYVFNSVEDFSKNTIQVAGSVRFNLNAK